MSLTNENQVLSDIIKTVFPKIKQYENDVPQNFKRPSFLLIRPNKSAEIRELTKFSYEQVRAYTVYGFCRDGDVEGLEEMWRKLVDCIMGNKKYLIPNSDNRYLTIERVGVETDDVNSVITFTFSLKQTLKRDLRLSAYPQINAIEHEVKPKEE